MKFIPSVTADHRLFTTLVRASGAGIDVGACHPPRGLSLFAFPQAYTLGYAGLAQTKVS